MCTFYGTINIETEILMTESEISIVIEKADESEFWLESIMDEELRDEIINQQSPIPGPDLAYIDSVMEGQT